MTMFGVIYINLLTLLATATPTWQARQRDKRSIMQIAMEKPQGPEATPNNEY